MSHDRAAYWDHIYTSKHDDEVSWYEPEPAHSLEFVEEALSRGARSLIDVGGGTSHLVDNLIGRDLDRLAVIDVSDSALRRSRERLGSLAGKVEWIIGDVTTQETVGTFDVWHDRAVFHFLVTDADRKRYAELAAKTVPPGGSLIIATFGPQGPTTCSGLDVRRYDQARLSNELGAAFVRGREEIVDHRTPAGRQQQFLYAMFARR